MRKEVFVLVFLALALAVAGCQGGGKGPVSSSSTPFIGGSEGLRVSFVENAPPTEVLDNPLGKTAPDDRSKIMNFDIILKLENAGEQDIAAGEGKVTISGIFPADFGVGVSGLTQTPPATLQNVLFPKKLDGVKKDPEGGKIPGGIDEEQFKNLGYVKELEGNTEFPIQADVCYSYATKAVGDFCMRSDLTRTQGGVCQAKGSKPVFSSGSPIQVVSLDESVGGMNKIILKFSIKTVGSGSFFKPETIGDTNTAGCPRGDFSKENFVRVTVKSGIAVSDPDSGLRCSGSTDETTSKQGVQSIDVRLTNGEGSVTCMQDGISVDAVQKVNLQIKYNHLISASTKLLVKHLPGFESGTTATTTTTTRTTASTTTDTAASAAGTQVAAHEDCDVPDVLAPPSTRDCFKSGGEEGTQICDGTPGGKGVWGECG